MPRIEPDTTPIEYEDNKNLRFHPTNVETATYENGKKIKTEVERIIPPHQKQWISAWDMAKAKFFPGNNF